MDFLDNRMVKNLEDSNLESKGFINTNEADNNNEEVESQSFKKIDLKCYKEKCFWLALIIVLLGFLIIGLVMFLKFYPACGSKPALSWWQKDIVYQIEVSNFKDSDGDGVGDINGYMLKIKSNKIFKFKYSKLRSYKQIRLR